MIDYDWYRSFVAIYQVGTVTAAAEERGLTQPAVTQHLAALEAVVGMPLFTRTARRMLPTERGKALYSEVVAALETLDRVSLALRHGKSTTLAEVRLGAPREYFSAVARAALAHLPLRWWVQFGSTSLLLESLRTGELDLVIASERLNLREIEYRKLAQEHFILVGSAECAAPVAQPANGDQQRLLEQWALQQPWVSYARDLPIIRRFWRQCFGVRAAIKPQLIVPDLILVIEAVAAGTGLSVLPAYLCAAAIASGQLRVLWAPEPPVTNDLWLAYRIRDRQQPDIMRACDAIMQYEQT